MEKKGKVRQARAAETRKRIVTAAKKLITENGFENVSIEEIAKEAEVSTGSFYTYSKGSGSFHRLFLHLLQKEGRCH